MNRLGLRINVALDVGLLMMTAMALIHLISFVLFEQQFLKNEKIKGYQILGIIQKYMSNQSFENDPFQNPMITDAVTTILFNSGYAGAVIADQYKNILFSFGTDRESFGDMERYIHDVFITRENAARFSGKTMGLFWLRNKYLILSAPLKKNETIKAAAAVVIDLSGLYSMMKQMQLIICIYIIINTLTITYIGVYRISKLTVKPVRRLLKRAEEYREDDTVLFLDDMDSGEFNQLSKSLNSMLNRISLDKKRLADTVKSLEQSNCELQRAQKEVIQAEKLASVGRLTAGIAHEIGNPVAIVLGYLDLLKHSDLPDSERKDFICRIEDEINRVNVIIRHLLDFSRPSKETVKTFSVHDILKEMIQMLQIQPMMKGIAITDSLQAASHMIKGDPDQLRQVFLNLFMNAADAILMAEKPGEPNQNPDQIQAQDQAQNKGMISVSTASADQELEIVIKDNGVGIPAEVIADIFDPFYTSKDPGKGTGLGLSVCFTIVEALNGRIYARSRPEEGTSFIILLPACEKDNHNIGR